MIARYADLGLRWSFHTNFFFLFNYFSVLFKSNITEFVLPIQASHFYLFCCYSNLEMTSYRTKYRVYFKKDLIRTKLLGISKTTLIDS